ncbi:MAG: putative penicillin-binding protein [Candidatus Magasanikbacteria bacterium]|nr:putative penicillin-binding protein [Candidatus Magasanikbacteria bacterium]
MTGAYAALANGNKIVPLNFVSEVKDSGGKIIWKYEAPTPIQIFDFAERERGRQAGYLVTDILSDRTARGKAFGETSLMDIGKRVPAKTGTTADFRDNWAFGFTPEFVVGVWTGNADNSPMHGVSGVAGAVPIWHDVMSYYYRHNDPPPIPIPIGIITKDICSTSGLLTTPVCPKTRTEKFISGTEPVSDDNWYQELTIDTKTKLLAESSCAAKTLKKIYLIPPPEYYGWLLAAGFEQPPFQDCEGHRAAYLKDAVTAPVIIAPLDGDTIQIDPNIDAALQKIPFIAGGIGGKNYVWTLNRQQFTVSQPIFLWSPRPGSYTLTLEGASGQVAFIVK